MIRKRITLLVITIIVVLPLWSCRQVNISEEKNAESQFESLIESNEESQPEKNEESQTKEVVESQPVKSQPVKSQPVKSQPVKSQSVESIESQEEAESSNTADVFEKGYNLPVNDEDRKSSESDCREAMVKIADIYQNADKGDSINAVISEETAEKMMDSLQELGYPVSNRNLQLDMRNFEKMKSFLADADEGINSNIVTYEINSNGGINRRQFIFDGTDMYTLYTNAVWSQENTPVITDTTYTRIKEWEYTKKGWFIFEYCVPEPPEVSEIVNGNVILRVEPQIEEYRNLAEKYLTPLGYQGNNLLCSNWDASHLDELDYNGMFESLYAIKYQKSFDSEQYPEGIPAEEFESLIMEYLPISTGQIRQYAIFDSEKQKYQWSRLGCGNYSPNTFGTSVPEITNLIENDDGTVTLVIDAVCEMLGSDAVISHQLTVQFTADGSIEYLENQILADGLEKIPAYQYRLK